MCVRWLLEDDKGRAHIKLRSCVNVQVFLEGLDFFFELQNLHFYFVHNQWNFLARSF